MGSHEFLGKAFKAMRQDSIERKLAERRNQRHREREERDAAKPKDYSMYRSAFRDLVTVPTPTRGGKFTYTGSITKHTLGFEKWLLCEGLDNTVVKIIIVTQASDFLKVDVSDCLCFITYYDTANSRQAYCTMPDDISQNTRIYNFLITYAESKYLAVSDFQKLIRNIPVLLEVMKKCGC